MDAAEAKSDNVDDVNVDVDHLTEGRETVIRYPATSYNDRSEARALEKQRGPAISNECKGIEVGSLSMD